MPTGTSTWNTLLSSNRRRSKGTIGQVMIKVHYACQVCESGMMRSMYEEDPEEVRRWAYCLGQLAGVYQRLAADSELSSKIDEVLQMKANGRQATGTLLLEAPADDGDETDE